ncbi:hypothetical protein [Methylobacterium indicum]|uniref:hypothetical protein n=1 Tax=Methylobacterium indicum TaxID=1775910 RepID=UPI002434D2F9|nr:hypothetical protein [Methylobacterium indicum]
MYRWQANASPAQVLVVSLIFVAEPVSTSAKSAWNGEDPALRRIARSAVPPIRLHISQLSQMQRMMGGGEG